MTAKKILPGMAVLALVAVGFHDSEAAIPAAMRYLAAQISTQDAVRFGEEFQALAQRDVHSGSPARESIGITDRILGPGDQELANVAPEQRWFHLVTKPSWYFGGRKSMIRF